MDRGGQVGISATDPRALCGKFSVIQIVFYASGGGEGDTVQACAT